MRCGTSDQGALVINDRVPVPPSFSTEAGPHDAGYLGSTPTLSTAILMPDGRTVVQTQPFHVCGHGGLVTRQYPFPDANLVTGDGSAGAHGGSGTSSSGGTLRVGERVPGGAIRHALKMELYGARYDYDDSSGATPRYWWQALATDAYAATTDAGRVPAVTMGSLLALPPSFRVGRLRLALARILARSLQDYGAYVVDDAAWDVMQVATEWGTRGRMINELERVWGFPFQPDGAAPCYDHSATCAWISDLAAITHLSVIDTNGPRCVGGCGPRRAPLAPPFKPPFDWAH